MKKYLLSAIAVPAMLTSVALGTVTAMAEETYAYRLWLGEQVTQSVQAVGAWQSNAILAQGCSSVRYAAENDGGTENAFLRLANFDGVYTAPYTAVDLPVNALAQSDTLKVSFSYRFSEGQTSYTSEDKVVSLSYGDETQTLTFADVALNAQGDYTWQSKTVALTVPSVQADKVTLSFWFDRTTTYTQSNCYFDVDNFTVKSGDVALNANGDFAYATVDTTAVPALSVLLSDEDLTAKSQYTLAPEDAVNYSVNTQYANTAQTSFEGGARIAMLARSGNSGTYRGATSVNAGEGDSFAIYDEAEENTFVRFANYNGNAGVRSTRMVVYFYDNASGALGNMPQVNKIYITFDYRLYIDDVTALGLSPEDKVLDFSTRSSSANNSGTVKLEQLIVNEPGDPSWHTYQMILETQLSKTASISVIFYGSEEATFEPTTFIDIDNIFFATYWNAKNYAHLNGTFEGLVPEDASEEINGEIYTNEVLGGSAQKYARSAVNYAMQLQPEQTVSLRLGWTPASNVYHSTFFVSEEAEKIGVYFSGRSGDYVELTVGADGYLNDGKVSVAWEESDGGYICHVYYVRFAKEMMQSVDFINVGSKAFILDDVFVGQVSSVCAEAGEYADYQADLTSMKQMYEEKKDSYAYATNVAIKRAFYKAEQINEYASLARMSKALNEISDLLTEGMLKADLSELNEALGRADGIINEYGPSAYTKATWLTFMDKVKEAREASENNTQSQIDKMTDALLAAIDGLQVAEQPQAAQPNTLAVALGVSGSAVGVGGIALGAFLIRRRKSK